MLSRGKLIVLAMLLLAAGLAVANMIFQTRASGRAVKHSGAEASRLILTAPHAEIIKLERASTDSGDDAQVEYLDVAGQRFAVAERRDVSQARGALHFRRALVTDDLYDWKSYIKMPPRHWRYALRFREGDAVCTLLLADDCEAASSLADPHPLPLRMNDKGESPLSEFVDEQFTSAAAAR